MGSTGALKPLEAGSDICSDSAQDGRFLPTHEDITVSSNALVIGTLPCPEEQPSGGVYHHTRTENEMKTEADFLLKRKLAVFSFLPD